MKRSTISLTVFCLVTISTSIAFSSSQACPKLEGTYDCTVIDSDAPVVIQDTGPNAYIFNGVETVQVGVSRGYSCQSNALIKSTGAEGSPFNSSMSFSIDRASNGLRVIEGATINGVPAKHASSDHVCPRMK